MRSQLPEIKLVIWDLDDTLWSGVLAAGGGQALRPGVTEVLDQLDRRGILCSIASKNHRGDALARLGQLGVAHYFLEPQIGWDAKSAAVGRIVGRVRIGFDAVMFIDDQPFERDEVASVYPEVTCLDPAPFAPRGYTGLLALPRLCRRFVTADSARRRQMLLEDRQRERDEQQVQGPKQAFLDGLQMKLTISDAAEEDLQRAEELTRRTNQLNATGRTYSYEELDRMRRRADHRLLICELRDRYGSYGKIGLVALETRPDAWRIRLLLMSCRVISRGVGTIVLGRIIDAGRRAGVALRADFVDTGRNRMMYLALRMAGFVESTGEAAGQLTCDLAAAPQQARHVDVDDCLGGERSATRETCLERADQSVHP